MSVHEERRVAQWFAAVAKVEGPEILGEAGHVVDALSSSHSWTGEAVPTSGRLTLELKAPSEKRDSGARASAAKEWLRLDSIAIGK
jgi:hypothetical protein